MKNDDFVSIGNSPLCSKIQELRKQGLSYKKIASQLNCAKSTVSFYCSKTTKMKNQQRIEATTK